MSSIFSHIGTHSHNRAIPQGGYISYKGKIPFNNPVGRTSGNIRPLTNNDVANEYIYKFGNPHPIKHYRRGILNPQTDIRNQQVRSSTAGTHAVERLIDGPGGYAIAPNDIGDTCNGIKVVSDWQPSVTLTDNPSAITQTKEFCCNEEKKALRMVHGPKPQLSKRYFTNTKEYLYNRGQTLDQRQYNYITSGNPASKPGGPAAVFNTYNANCASDCVLSSYNNTAGTSGETNVCNKVVYKPSNYKFAKQGAVSGNERIDRLNVDALLYRRPKYII